MGLLVVHHEDHKEYEGQAGKFSHAFFVNFVLFVVVNVLLDFMYNRTPIN